MREAMTVMIACVVVGGGCASKASSPETDAAIDRAARASVDLGGRCCDPAQFTAQPAPEVPDPEEIAMRRAGAEMWTPNAPRAIELCGVRTEPKSPSFQAYQGKLAQVIVSAGLDCPKLLEACLRTLPEPTRHRRDDKAELVLYSSASTTIRIVRIQPDGCTIALQHARLVTALEAAMTAEH